MEEQKNGMVGCAISNCYETVVAPFLKSNISVYCVLLPLMTSVRNKLTIIVMFDHSCHTHNTME